MSRHTVRGSPPTYQSHERAGLQGYFRSPREEIMAPGASCEAGSWDNGSERANDVGLATRGAVQAYSLATCSGRF